jgi:hypothetical protein
MVTKYTLPFDPRLPVVIPFFHHLLQSCVCTPRASAEIRSSGKRTLSERS